MAKNLTDMNENYNLKEAENQIEAIAQQCHRENLAAVLHLEGKKDLILRECRQSMEEITYTKAYWDYLSDENRYLDFFQNIKLTYEKESRQILRELIEAVGKNGSQMMDHFKYLFRSIGGYAYGLGNQKFYQEYEINREDLEAGLMKQAASADLGSSVIMTFAQETKNGIQTILRKLKRKKKLLTWLPLLPLLAVCVTGAYFCYPDARQQFASETPIPNSTTRNHWTAKLIGLGPLFSLVYFLAGLASSLGSVFIFLVLLCLVLYTVYLSSLNGWYKRQAGRRCEAYLKNRFQEFCQNQELEKSADEAIQNMVFQYEQQYLAILNRILKGTPFDRRAQKTW